MPVNYLKKSVKGIWKKHVLKIIPKDRYPITAKNEGVVKNLVHTTLKNMQEQGKIKVFNETPHSKEGYLKMHCTTDEGENLTIMFCVSKVATDKKYFLLESHSHSLLIRLKPTIGQKIFESFFIESLDKHVAGFKNEKKFLEVLVFLKNNCQNKNIVSVKQADKKGDMNGVDFFVNYRDSYNRFHCLRLQLKSSLLGQKKHKDKFPHIPSIVWTESKYPDHKVTFLMIDLIMTNFSNGKIVHL